VEITGPNGTLVFDGDGDYHAFKFLWSVKFLKAGKQLLACPLTDLKGIEVYVGGMLKVKVSGNGGLQTCFDVDDDNHAMGMAPRTLQGGSNM
jgi:hypothetical protein